MRRAAVHRIACGIVAAEVHRIRDADLVVSDKGDWPEATLIGDGGLGLDSLERLGALGALAETFGLDDSLLDDSPPRTIGDWVDWIMLGHDAGAGHILVRTSGSTGNPQMCRHAIADLLDEAAFLAAKFPDRQRVIALVPAHHLYGMIWTALLPAALGLSVVVRRLGAPLGLRAGDLVVAVPDQWRAILRLARALPADVVGVSSAGPLDPATADDLLAAGLARLVDVYGSSETSAIGLRELPAADYDLVPRWRLGADGADDWQLIDRDGRAVAIPDHVQPTGERSLLRLGRRDGAVQIGGCNVWPERVAQVLREVKGVAAATVRLGANGRLKAFVVPHAASDPAGLPGLIDRAVAARLTEPERPKNIQLGSDLPRNTMGKLTDW